MHDDPPDPNTPRQLEDTTRSPDDREQRTPGQLSQSDPEPERATRRPPIWLVVIVLLIAAVIVLHLTGVAGPGSH